MKKVLLIGVFFAASITLVTAQTSFALLDFTARSDSSSSPRSDPEADRAKLRERVHSAFTVTRSGTLHEKRAEIEQRVEQRRAEVRDKLSGHRADTCKQKQQGINQALASRTAAAQRYLAKFKEVDQRLIKFVTDNQLAITNGQTYIDVMQARYDDAAAIIGTAENTAFDCLVASADDPGRIVRTLVRDSKDALEKYRSSIKDYAEVVKAQARKEQANGTQSE